MSGAHRGPEADPDRHSDPTAGPVPVLLADTDVVAGADSQAGGALWRLEAQPRDLDANIIAIPPEGQIDTHDGPAIDVLIHVLAGSGEVRGHTGSVPLRPGALVWLPRGSRRTFAAGPQGLRYLTVHQRKQGLSLGATRSSAP